MSLKVAKSWLSSNWKCAANCTTVIILIFQQESENAEDEIRQAFQVFDGVKIFLRKNDKKVCPPSRTGMVSSIVKSLHVWWATLGRHLLRRRFRLLWLHLHRHCRCCCGCLCCHRLFWRRFCCCCLCVTGNHGKTLMCRFSFRADDLFIFSGDDRPSRHRWGWGDQLRGVLHHDVWAIMFEWNIYQCLVEYNKNTHVCVHHR